MIHQLKKILPFKKTVSRKPTQKEVVEFMLDKKTLETAAAGSMQKRNDLLRRVGAA